MDVDQILLGVQERDKWRRRLETLRGSLTDVKRKRAHIEERLRRIRRELAELARLTDAVLDVSRRSPVRNPIHAARPPHLPGR
jgi:chromosome segregation ATPase